MRKIPTLFKREFVGKDFLAKNEVASSTDWVLRGEGVPTRKWDGTCCLIQESKLYKRRDVKKGRKPPTGFIPAQDPDPKTGHWPGWVLVDNSPDDKWFKAAWDACGQSLPDGTYELCGPHFQGNPEGLEEDKFLLHGRAKLLDAPRTFKELEKYLASHDIEGIVWHHPDGRMVKIKGTDFGIKRGAPE